MGQLLGTICLLLHLWWILWMRGNTCSRGNVRGMDWRSNRQVHVWRRCGAVRVFHEGLFWCRGMPTELCWNWILWWCRHLQRYLVDVWKSIDGWVVCHTGGEDSPIHWVVNMDHRRTDRRWSGSSRSGWLVRRHYRNGCDEVHVESLRYAWRKQFWDLLKTQYPKCGV